MFVHLENTGSLKAASNSTMITSAERPDAVVKDSLEGARHGGKQYEMIGAPPPSADLHTG